MEDLGVDITIFVVAFFMGLPIAWINLGDQVKNFGVGLLLTLLVVVVGFLVVSAVLPEADLTTDESLPRGGRIDIVISQWTEAILNVVVRQSPVAFWGGLLAGIGTFLFWKNQHETSG